MKIDKVIELENGRIEFRGEVEGAELDALISYGLNTLLSLGMIKATIIQENEDDPQMPFDFGDSTVQ